MKKIGIILVGLIFLFGFMPVEIAETDVAVTGTFTPTPSGVSISCNNTSPIFGAINLGGNGIVGAINVSNDGDVNCSVTMQAEDGAGTWTLVAGTSSPATTNEYCLNVNPADMGYVDAYSEQTISSDLPPSGAGQNYTYFHLKLYVSQYTDEGTPSQQTLYSNLTASSLT